MIQTRRLKNVISIQTILSFVLSRKIKYKMMLHIEKSFLLLKF